MLSAMNILDQHQSDEGFVGVVVLEGLFDKTPQRVLRLLLVETRLASIPLTIE